MNCGLLLAEAETLVQHWPDPGTLLLNLFGILVIVFLNGFFVATEFALVKVRTSQLDPLIEEGDGRAKTAKYILSHLDSYLSATQFGVTLASLALGWVGEPYVTHLLQPLFFLAGITSHAFIKTVSVIVGFTGITFLHIIVGELAPK